MFLGAGSLTGRLGDPRVRGAGRARVQSSCLVREHAGEAVRDVRPAVVATWHLLDRHPPLPVHSHTQPTTKYSSSPLTRFTNRPSCTPISANVSLPRFVSGRTCENRRFHRVTDPHIAGLPSLVSRRGAGFHSVPGDGPPPRFQRVSGGIPRGPGGGQSEGSIHPLHARNTVRRVPGRPIWEILLRVILNLRLHGEPHRESCREGTPG